MPVKDQYDREFRTLRLSLTDVCNLACVYCVPPEGIEVSTARADQPGNLKNDDLLQLVSRLHQLLDLKVVRLTGGEPLLYRQLVPLVAGIAQSGITSIKMTTNGFLLEDKAAALKQAGLSSVNISLDALDPETFKKISRRNNLAKIIRGIDKAIDLGMEVKLNAVILKGINEQEIIPLLEFAMQRNVQIRYLEIMKMGHLFDGNAGGESAVFTEAEIVKVIEDKMELSALTRKPSSTANHWKTKSGYVFGIIANESSPFCSDCDRLRIDNAGNMYGCLSSNIPIKLDAQESDAQWNEKFALALSHKQTVRFKGSALSMIEIGG